jgi:hypothetical protein
LSALAAALRPCARHRRRALGVQRCEAHTIVRGREKGRKREREREREGGTGPIVVAAAAVGFAVAMDFITASVSLVKDCSMLMFSFADVSTN